MIDPAARRQLAADLDAAARLTGDFVLRSGARATEYFDKYRFEADPALLSRVAAAMIPLVPEDAQVLAGVELGGVPIATAMSLAGGKPAAFVRKEAKTYGTCLAVEGGDLTGKRVVIVEDVISTGGAVRDAKARLDEAGAVTVAVVCALWRGPMPPAIAGLDVPVLPALTLEDMK
ncbi:orotate phosphoribosyltransferase [Phenylobacterium sp.]|uniref:orotate phosphoribosyltransferase n=1 Tax=Phenylobacterium sp. TaxID=1871053 RepID=UPI00289AAF2B|nr:orotate phosphoribosyltransferase [Phenylobacterium sp.]